PFPHPLPPETRAAPPAKEPRRASTAASSSFRNPPFRKQAFALYRCTHHSMASGKCQRKVTKLVSYANCCAGREKFMKFTQFFSGHYPQTSGYISIYERQERNCF